jgi:hypothetical protein
MLKCSSNMMLNNLDATMLSGYFFKVLVSPGNCFDPLGIMVDLVDEASNIG